ncbi:MAG TPA: hypothetical protein VNA12_01950 [Mycobacteriales bacterium]|nr:hypothetical protein [Mycobacteriales bacterium]
MTALLGAYGLVVHGAPTGGRWLHEQDVAAPHLTMAAGSVDDEEVVGEGRAVLRTRTGRLLDVRRSPLTVRVGSPHPAPDEYVHPVLAGAAVMAHHWGGRLALHGGVVAGAHGAVLLLADRGVGKTTTLAALSNHVAVLADDVAIVGAGAWVLAGPRCLDLRPEALPLLGDVALRDPTPVRGGDRLRVTLGLAPLVARVSAVVHLTSGPDRIDSLPPASRIARLLEHVALRVVPSRTAVMLDLLPVPTYVVGATRGAVGVSFARDAVLSLLDNHAA